MHWTLSGQVTEALRPYMSALRLACVQTELANCKQVDLLMNWVYIVIIMSCHHSGPVLSLSVYESR